MNGGSEKAVNPSNGLQAVSVPAGTTKLVLNLPADIVTGMFYVWLLWFMNSRSLKRISQRTVLMVRLLCIAVLSTSRLIVRGKIFFDQIEHDLTSILTSSQKSESPRTELTATACSRSRIRCSGRMAIRY